MRFSPDEALKTSKHIGAIAQKYTCPGTGTEQGSKSNACLTMHSTNISYGTASLSKTNCDVDGCLLARQDQE